MPPAALFSNKQNSATKLYTPLFLQTRAVRSRKQAQKARRLADGTTASDVAGRLNRIADLLDGKATADELDAAALDAQQEHAPTSPASRSKPAALPLAPVPTTADTCADDKGRWPAGR